MGVYAIRHNPSGRVYVGSAVSLERRWIDHRSALGKGRHHASKLQRAWAKYGADAFSFEVLERVDDAASLLIVEQRWIDSLEAASPRNFNSRPKAASNLGVRHTDEARAKMSEVRRAGPHHTRGKQLPPEWVAKMAAGRRGKMHSEETKERMRAHRQTPEFRARMSEVAKARPPHSAEAREKMAAASRAYWAAKRAAQSLP